jgi:hypothetical protein
MANRRVCGIGSPKNSILVACSDVNSNTERLPLHGLTVEGRYCILLKRLAIQPVDSDRVLSQSGRSKKAETLRHSDVANYSDGNAREVRYHITTAVAQSMCVARAQRLH